MAWNWITAEGRSGALRNLLFDEGQLFQRVNECWQALEEPRQIRAKNIALHAGLRAKGKAVFYYIFRRMLREYRQYLEQIDQWAPDYYLTVHPDKSPADLASEARYAMMLDTHQQMAWYLAARRADAVMLLGQVPKTFDGSTYPWMKLESPARRRKDGRRDSLHRKDS